MDCIIRASCQSSRVEDLGDEGRTRATAVGMKLVPSENGLGQKEAIRLEEFFQRLLMVSPSYR